MKRKLVREDVNGTVYEYVPLGKHIVSAPGVCRGRPTFKYTRIEVAGVRSLLRAGKSIGEVVTDYEGRISRQAVQEAISLAARALVKAGTQRLVAQ
jgi:uncharacterized protein (DUF433 family)